MSKFRGDTLRLGPSTSSHPAPRRLFATTRGAKPDIRGWLCVLDLDPKTGLLLSAPPAQDDDATTGDKYAISRWRTPTSGGKANAIELIARPAINGNDGEDEGVYVVLTDDDERSAAGVRVLEWTPTEGFGVVAEWPSTEEGPEVMEGGSHAVWLD
jgi:carboxy-cis,cis-muconate cyclase